MGIVHFELKVKNVEKTIKFYKDVFGWKIEKWEGPMDYWLEMTGDESEPGIIPKIIEGLDLETKEGLELINDGIDFIRNYADTTVED